jgi:hypothetical protein
MLNDHRRNITDWSFLRNIRNNVLWRMVVWDFCIHYGSYSDVHEITVS